jgi:amino acid adenylation domain-containing protein
MEPESPAYNLAFTLELSGPLDVAALDASLQAMVERHETLRTIFVGINGEPRAKILQSLPVLLKKVDLRENLGREAAARKIAIEDARSPFDLARGPLLRVTLVQLEAERHILLLAMHHIASDAWSMGVFWHELGALYNATVHGQSADLPELPIQYVDFAVWQRQWLQDDVLERQLNYWTQQLAGAPATLDLPTDRPRPRVQRFYSATHTAELPFDLGQALDALARKQDSTPFMVLLAAFQTLLSRYSGQTNIVVGTAMANRTQIELESLIGFFVNTLVLRTHLEQSPTFRELLTRTREITLGAYEHQDLPFEKLVEALHPQRDLSYTPLVQVMFGLQNAPAVELEMTNLRARTEVVPLEGSSFDLALSITESAQGLAASFEYNTDLFDAATVARMAGHYRTLLESTVANTEARIAQLPMLTQSERAELLHDEIDVTDTSLPEQCVHELFELQAAETPNATALVFKDQSLSYQELNTRANQLAHRLRELGVGPEVRVALCLERSLDLVVGLLAILKAGGAFVPIEPNSPRERMAFLLADSQAPVLVTYSTILELLPAYSGATILLDSDQRTSSNAPTTTPVSGVMLNNLAYVIYTSGTTGQPKGVLVEHGNLIHTLRASQAEFRFTCADIMPCLASFAFDIALFELFSPLLVGGTCVVVAKEQVQDVVRLAELLPRVTALHVVPSLMRQLVTFLMSRSKTLSIEKLRMVFTGGDAVPPDLLGDLQRVFSDAHLYVLYGPTEATIICARYRVLRDAPTQHQMIGRVFPSMRLRLYDAHQQLVPMGVRGEIYIGGASVSRGYLARPELTAEKFVTLDGERFYRTGDLARYRADLNLEFLGRNDTQVKIRGYRIELGEIESILVQHPAVRDAVVLAREDMPGDKRLVAYVVLRAANGIGRSELRTFLKQKLPEYMVPSAILFLAALPLSANGKVDRRALPVPEYDQLAAESEFVEPRTSLEETIATIWADILKLPRVGIHDNFFELGGHSLLATQVISRLRTSLGIELPLRTIFEAPTVEELAVAVLEYQLQNADHALVNQLFAELESLSDEELQARLNSIEGPTRE